MGKNKAGRQENTANAGYKTALVSGFQKLLIKMLVNSGFKLTHF